MRFTFLAAATLYLSTLCCVSSTSAVGIINGDFETGDFTGWTVALPHPRPGRTYFRGDGYNVVANGGPGDSEHYAKLYLDNGSHPNGLDFPPPGYDYVYQGPPVYPRLEQTFEGIAGSILSFDITWTADFTDYRRTGLDVVLVGPEGTEFTFSKQIITEPPRVPLDPLHGDWQKVSYTLQHDGEYTLTLVPFVGNLTQVGTSTSSKIEIGADNFYLHIVPEPSSRLMLSTAGIVLAGVVVRSRAARRSLRRG